MKKAYEQNKLIVKRVGRRVKATIVNNCLESGYEYDDGTFTPKGQAGNESKLLTNVCRAKRTVNEYALCNPWTFFVTLTLDPQKYDRYNLGKFIKDLSQFIRDYRKKYGVSLRYLLIPEMHQDGSWHLHGLFYGLPIEHLHAFTLDEKLPYRIRERLYMGKCVFTWEAYAKKFGFCVIEFIDNQEATANYITKYITKDLSRTISDLNAHIFYASKGLKKAETVQVGTAKKAFENPDYVGEYASIKWFDRLEDAQEYFENYDDIPKVVSGDYNTILPTMA